MIFTLLVGLFLRLLDVIRAKQVNVAYIEKMRNM
jgi:hypothetical protein